MIYCTKIIKIFEQQIADFNYRLFPKLLNINLTVSN